MEKVIKGQCYDLNGNFYEIIETWWCWTKVRYLDYSTEIPQYKKTYKTIAEIKRGKLMPF